MDQQVGIGTEAPGTELGVVGTVPATAFTGGLAAVGGLETGGYMSAGTIHTSAR
jgi:hypothetical protein